MGKGSKNKHLQRPGKGAARGDKGGKSKLVHPPRPFQRPAAIPPSAGGGKKHGKKSAADVLAAMADRLQGGQFRWINEMLYKETGEEALRQFKEDKTLFDAYHKGYAMQVAKWPEDPLDRVIDVVRNTHKGGKNKLRVADMGCGVARLAETLMTEDPKHFEIHSFDLVAHNKHVVECNIADVPLEDNSMDVVVFCLSLMGTDYVSFICEGWRILRPNGLLIIAETKSRIKSVGRFIRGVETLGFDRTDADESNKMFVLFQFVKNKSKTDVSEHDRGYAKKQIDLQPCIYKRR